MSINHIRLYDFLRRELHLPDDKAADAVYAIREITDSSIASKKYELATKEDIRSLELKTKESINSLKEDICSFKLETKENINSLKANPHFPASKLAARIDGVNYVTKTDIQNSGNDLCRAIYLSAILQCIATAEVMLIILKWLK